MEINKKISSEKLNSSVKLCTHNSFDIYSLSEDVEYFFAVNQNNLICSCFEFVEQEDGYLLAHMHTMKNLKGQGIGTVILKEAIKYFDYFDFPSTNNNDIYYFIEDGYEWVQRRFADNTLSSKVFKRP